MSDYKHHKQEIDASRVMLQIVASLTDNSRGVIYYNDIFIAQAIDLTQK